jgi:ribonuclease HI
MSNNQEENEAFLVGIKIAKELRATMLVIRSDSQLMVSQIRGDYSAKEPILQRYLAKVKEILEGIYGF